MDTQPAELNFLPVTPERLEDLTRLFEARGGPHNCWCMVWCATPAEARDTSSAARKAAFSGRVLSGTPVGILGYRAGTPVAWCSVAPRTSYRNLGGAPEQPKESVWSIVCFYVPRSERGKGVTAQLIEAAVAHARGQGATTIEAYPVEADSPSYRFMGFISAFVRAGFVETGRAGRRRHIMRPALATG